MILSVTPILLPINPRALRALARVARYYGRGRPCSRVGARQLHRAAAAWSAATNGIKGEQ